MSEVISFRLDKENPREAQAYEILKVWYAGGYSIRHTITEALLRLDEAGTVSVPDAARDDMIEVLHQVKQVLEQIQNGDSLSYRESNAGDCPASLTENFVASIRQAAKPGMKLD
jgi:hypothetical protein